MSAFFFAACIMCILYCALYGGYSVVDKHISQAVSAFVMTALAAGAAVVLMMVS